MDWLTISTVVSVAAFTIVAMFQVALAAGVSWGHAAYGAMSQTLHPGLRTVSAVAVALMILVIILVFRRYQGDGFWFLGADGVRNALWVVSAFLAINVVMNAISRSKVERNFATPLSVVALVSTVLVNLLAD